MLIIIVVVFCFAVPVPLCTLVKQEMRFLLSINEADGIELFFIELEELRF